MNNCIFDGAKCIAFEDNCNLYQPSGVNDAAKAEICNKIYTNPYNRCTFVGGNSCVNAEESCDYTLPVGS